MQRFIMACQTGDLPVVKTFVAEEDSPPSTPSSQDLQPDSSFTTLSNGLDAAIEHDQPQVVDYLLDRGLRAHQGLMWRAVRHNTSNEMFDVLMREGRWDINECRNHALPPFLAMVTHDERLVNHFLHLGADSNIACRRGHSSFMAAAQHGTLQTVKIMYAAGGDSSYTIPYAVLGNGPENLEILEYLLNAGSHIDAFELENCQWGFDGHICPLTGLHYAANYGKKEMVELLLRHGANVDVKDRFNRTPEDLAASNGYADIVELLRDPSQRLAMFNI